MVDAVDSVQDGNNRLVLWLAIALWSLGYGELLTPARMIQMTVTAAFLMTMEQKRDARAPSRVIARSPSCVPRAHLTCFLVLWLIGVHVDLFSKLPHYLYCQCCDKLCMTLDSRVRAHTVSGCLLKLSSGPLGFGFGGARVRLACVTALGLNPGSVGPWKV